MPIYKWMDIPDPITTAGIYHSPDLGLISYSADGTTWYTIADKDLGATQVYGQGLIYQRGNNYGHSGAISKDSTQVNASTYGPGNYYNSSTYITGGNRSAGRDSSDNNNLWGGQTGTNEAKRGPCPEGYHIWTSSEFETIANIVIGLIGSNEAEDCKPYFLFRSTGRRDYGGTWSTDSSRTWRTSSHGSRGGCGSYVHLYTTPSRIGTYGTTNAFPIRPMKNEAVQPYDDWTVLFQPSN